MKELFVFGAGASHACCRTPLGKDLVWNYFEDTSTMYEIGHGGRPASRDLEAKNREYQLFGDFLKSMGGHYYEYWQKCMGEAMMFSPEIEKYHYIDEVMDILNSKGDEQGIKLIKKLTVEHITKTTDEIQGTLYKQFVQNLKGRRQEEVTIFSFNYDCLLREDSQNRIGFDYLIPFDSVNPGNLSENEKSVCFPLIKLNGSLDWAMDTSTKKIVRLCAYLVSRNKYSFQTAVEPYIFLPHQHKDDIIKTLWERAKDEIRSATKITIIGYSFPAYDKDVISLFSQNIQLGAEVEVIDFCNDDALKNRKIEEIKRRYKQLFPQASIINVSLDGFQGFIDKAMKLN
jgi:hypothetical protein